MSAQSKTTKATVAPIQEIKPCSFIYEMRNALAPQLCTEMVQRFEAMPEQQYQGRIGQDNIEEKSIKVSTDLRISGRKDWQSIDNALFQSLSQALNAMSAQHPFFAANSFKDVGYNMQRTRPGELYHWHVDGGPGEFSQRQLVAIWYLNEVGSPGGETEFLFQEVKIGPETGKLVLFPPFWTHVHRGIAPQKRVKYIATTWVSFTGPRP